METKTTVTDNSHIFNKYWKISWGYIFDYLDKEAHRIAVERIGECVTASAEIKYFKEQTEALFYGSFEIIEQRNSSIVLMYCTEEIFATFTFIKRKK